MSISQTKNILLSKERITEQKISLKSSFGPNFGTYKNDLFDMLDRNQGFSATELEEFLKNEIVIKEYSKKLKISDEELKKSFKKGAEKFLKTNLIASKNGANEAEISIKNILISFGLFVRSTLSTYLHHKNNKRNDKKIILYTIENPHTLNANTFFELKKEYAGDPFVTEYLIKYFITHNSKDPIATINLAKNNYEKIKKLYKKDAFISDGMIKYFVINTPQNIESVMEQVKSDYLELNEIYKNDDFVDSAMIKKFLTKNTNSPQRAIEKARSEYIEYCDIYKDNDIITQSIIRYFVVNNSGDPQTAIDNYKNNSEILLKKYENDPIIEKWMVKNLSMKFPQQVEDKIKLFKFLLKKFKNKYQKYGFENGMIEKVILRNLEHPETSLETMKKDYLELTKIYEDDDFVDDSTIKKFLTDNAEKPQKDLEDAKKIYKELKLLDKEGQNLDFEIKRCAIGSPLKAKEIIEKNQPYLL